MKETELVGYIYSSINYPFELNETYKVSQNDPIDITFSPYEIYQKYKTRGFKLIYKVKVNSENVIAYSGYYAGIDYYDISKFTVIDIIRTEDFVNEIKGREEKQWWKDGVFLDLCYRLHKEQMKENGVNIECTNYKEDSLIISVSPKDMKGFPVHILIDFDGNERDLRFNRNKRYQYKYITTNPNFVFVYDIELNKYNIISPSNEILLPNQWFTEYYCVHECCPNCFKITFDDKTQNVLFGETGKLLTKHNLSDIEYKKGSRYMIVRTIDHKRMFLDTITDELIEIPIHNIQYYTFYGLGYDIFILDVRGQLTVVDHEGKIILHDIYSISENVINDKLIFCEASNSQPQAYIISSKKITNNIDYDEVYKTSYRQTITE